MRRRVDVRTFPQDPPLLDASATLAIGVENCPLRGRNTATDNCATFEIEVPLKDGTKRGKQLSGRAAVLSRALVFGRARTLRLRVAERVMEILEHHPTIDGVLEAWNESLGADYAGYRNHVYRVFNYTRALMDDSERYADVIAVAAAFHDLGVWSHATMDYLEPSARLAVAHVAGDERRAWARTIELMIVMHHKLLPYHGEAQQLVEPFRRADLCDLSVGLVRSGVDRDLVVDVKRRFPDEGIGRGIRAKVLRWMVTHPLRPWPMIRL